jgi:hypothetical protein
MCVDLLALIVYILQPHVPAKDTQKSLNKNTSGVQVLPHSFGA